MKKFKLVKEKWYFQSLRETKSVQALEDWAVEISWYASTKDKDRWWDIVEPKAFQSALERYMTNPIVLLQHKTDKPIGIVEEADIDDNWLWIKAKISQNTDWVIDLIKNWVLRAFSIWYSIKDYETDVRELADWSYDMTNIIKDLELYEISVVSVPMNPYALSKSVEDLLEVEETADEENSDDLEEETVEESETVEEETPAEENVEEKEEEKRVETVVESEETKEWVVEWINVQDEETVVESETEAPEETEEIEHPNEEVETKEINEEENEKVDSEEHSLNVDWPLWTHFEPEDDESETKEADENSEIDEESVEEDSENADETPADDEVVDETSNDEVIETKSIETESQKQFDFKSEFAMLQKSFDEKLAEKDEKIKSLESKVETMTKLFAESVETIDRMATAVKNTPVNSGLQYKRPLKKWWYFDVASIIKSL